MATKPRPDSKVKFVQIVANDTGVFGLTKDGEIWWYAKYSVTEGYKLGWTKIESPNQD